MLRPVDFLSELELANHDAGVDFLTVREPPNCHYGVERADPYDEVVQPVLIHERGRGEVICVAFTFWFVLRPLAMLANQSIPRSRSRPVLSKMWAALKGA